MPIRSTLLLAWLATTPAAAAPLSSAAVAVAVAVPTQTATRVGADGAQLTDETWQSAPAISEFLQREPAEGSPPSQRTEFRIAYDATTLYVKVRAFDSEPDKIVGYLTRRDADSPSDWLRVGIDSYHDRRTAYEFAVNPSGVKQDFYWFNDNNRDDSWDAVWDVAVSRDHLGWVAEFRIPFSQLRFTPNQSNTFGLAIARQIGRLNEMSTWPLLARSATGFVSSFGELTGLSMTQSPKRLEITPYSVASMTTQPAGDNPLVITSAPGGALGADLKYALTPGLTLTTTINPDFGQVEADPAVVNLTAFETFFSERRPFFVEGSGNFRFDTDCNDGECTGLFYSRRIGRTPQGADDLPDGDDVFTNAPLQTTIFGAAKLTGRIGKFSFGAMHAVTQQEVASVLSGAVRSKQSVEPLTGYSVGRVRREFANQSSAGFILTATNRRVRSALDFLANDAYTG
ncbi:MAG: carbohydrate binding family 9 domain-containing protein, partial [Acidobacteria bacterium]|nr:carbohydrate binding family 9 domain-containing protein [Acidobacteriota bacterium]